MRSLDAMFAALLVVGGLNWGLVGFFGFDIVAGILGPMSDLSRVVYVLVGIAGVYQSLSWKSIRRRWALSPISAASR